MSAHPVFVANGAPPPPFNSGRYLIADADEIWRSLNLLFPDPNALIETRVLMRDHMDLGLFDNREWLIKCVTAARTAKAIYVGLNKIAPEVPVTNRLKFGRRGDGISAHQIVSRDHLLIDVDPIRPTNVSSTDAEHDLAIEQARFIKYWLSENGWPDPLFCDSGNGGHLIYRLNLPNDRSSEELIKAILAELQRRFGTASLNVDQSVYDAPRICKLWGTIARKGQSTPERPHRPSRIISAPKLDLVTVSLEPLKDLAGEYASPRITANKARYAKNGSTIEDFLQRHNIQHREKQPYKDGYKWQLDHCPFNPEHKAPDSAVYELNNGARGFHCSHNSCNDKEWREFREHFEGYRQMSAPPVVTPSPATTETSPATPDRQDLMLKGGETTFNDSSNAERIRLFSNGGLLWSENEKSWYTWDGRRYRKNNMAARKTAKLAMAAFLTQAIAAGAEDYRKFASRSLNSKNIEGALALLRPDVCIEVAEFDKDRHLLNFQNGTVDLRTGSIREHRQSDRITRLIHHDYVPGAAAPLFHKFLSRVAPDLIDSLQVALGYSVTGEVSAKVLFIAYGPRGNNGKTTLLDTVRDLVVEYSTKIMVDSLMVKREGSSESNNALSDLADLRGARFANTSETESGQRISEGKLKRLTQGMGTIKTVRKFENAIEFPETHKLWIDANHLPVVKDSDPALWNRLFVFPFNVEIPQHEVDRQLPAKLAAEGEGILAWLVEGARQFYAQGLSKSQIVKDAITEYKSEMDIVASFIDERCNVRGDAETYIGQTELWEAYLRWAQSQTDQKRLDRSAFKQYLITHNFKEGKIEQGKVRVFRGISLRG